MADEMQVYILHVSHKHGDDFMVFRTEASAKQGVIDWARSCWADEVGDDVPMPDDDALMANRYFEHVGYKESYVIRSCYLQD